MQPGGYEFGPKFTAFLIEEARKMGKFFSVVPHDPSIGGDLNPKEVTMTPLRDCVVIPLEGLGEKATEFASMIRKGLSSEWCKCVWAIHPDDLHIQADRCRQCGAPDSAPAHQKVDTPGDNEAFNEAHPFRGRRRRMVQEHPLCPSHTAGGLLLGFLQWMNPEDKRLEIPGMLHEVEAVPTDDRPASSGSPEDD